MGVECEWEEDGGDQPRLDSKGKKKPTKKTTPNKQNPQSKMTSIPFLRKLHLLFKE